MGFVCLLLFRTLLGSSLQVTVKSLCTSLSLSLSIKRERGPHLSIECILHPKFHSGVWGTPYKFKRRPRFCDMNNCNTTKQRMETIVT